MDLPKIKTKVRHSLSKSAWNVVGCCPGEKYKIARVPYIETGDNREIDIKNRREAYNHAMFISICFNTAFIQNNYERKINRDI